MTSVSIVRRFHETLAWQLVVTYLFDKNQFVIVISVMLFLRNLQNINTIIIVGGLALCLVFTFQVKQIYNKNQKYNRYLGYKQYMTEISSEMTNAEKLVNKSTVYVRQLIEVLAKHERDGKNTSIQTVTLYT